MGGRIEIATESRHLAGELVTLVADVSGATRVFEAAGPGCSGERLGRVGCRRGGGAQCGAEIQHAVTLQNGVLIEVGRGAGEECFDLVGGEVGPLLEQHGDRTGDHGRGLGGT